MAAIKIIHASDFHLDSAFGGLPEEKSRQRRQESRQLMDRLAALVNAEQAQLVLLTGDLFDSVRAYPETVERLQAALASMACPVFITPGNHDPLIPGSPYLEGKWPENVHIFRSEDLTAVELPELNCVVYGAAFTSPQRQSEALQNFSAPADGKIHIGCLHGEVDGGGSPHDVATREQIARSGLDYLAMGHIHRGSGLQKEGKTVWAYPGCLEGRGFDELGEKGLLVGTVEQGKADLEFVPLCRRRYRIIEADVTGRSIQETMEDALRAVDEDICRVILTGETTDETPDLAALERDFAGHCYFLQLRDETRVARDIWERAGEDSLRGLFLSELRRRYDAAADEEERKKIDLAVRFGLAALDGRDIG